MKRLLLLITISLFTLSSFAQKSVPVDSLKKDTLVKVKKDSVKFIPNKPIQIIQLESSSKKDKSAKGSKKESGSAMKSSSMSTMSSLPSGNDAGRTIGSLDISGSGAATYALPIAVPPGINGVAPQIALTYNSQGGNGIAGYGWSISGLSAITRIPRTMFHDGVIGGVNGNINDRFALDGERLLLKSGTYGANGAEYQTENYSNLRIVSRGSIGSTGPAYFDVYYPDGSHAVYGQNTDSFTKNTYAINYIDNPRNARISYSYTKSNETLVISHIDYGALSSGTPMNQISFAYTTRSRNQQSYINGTALYQTALLNGINVKGSGGTGYRNYVLEHDYVEALNYDRLIGVQEKSGDGSKSFDPITFGYGSTVDNIDPNGYVIGYTAAGGEGSVTADFTGDGKMDMLFYGYNNIYLTLDPAGGTAYSQPTQQITVDPFEGIFPVSTLDGSNRLFPGQGFTIVNQPNALNVVFKTYLPNLYGNSIAAPVEKTWTNVPKKPIFLTDCTVEQPYSVQIPRSFFSGDFNGDGLTDIISISRPYTQINSATSDGNGGCTINTTEIDVSTVHFINLDKRITTGFVTQAGSLSLIYDSLDEIYTADFNGDGKTDFIHITQGLMYVYGLNESNNLVLLFAVSDSSNIFVGFNRPRLLGDFNGDGNSDIMFPVTTSSFALFTSTSNGFVTHMITPPFNYNTNSISGSTLKNYYLTANDVNGDGKTDIISSTTVTTGATSTASVTIYNNSSTSASGEPIFTAGGTKTPPSINLGSSPTPLFFSNNETNYAAEYGFFGHNNIILFRNQKDNRQEVAMSSVSQNGIDMAIDYHILTSGTLSGTLPFYKSSKGQSYAPQTYPYIDIESQPGLRAVSQLTRTFDGHALTQYFGYNGGVSHADGLGFLGFNETVRTNWITGPTDNNRKYTTNVYNPKLRGALVRSFLSKDTLAYNSAIKNKLGTTPDIVISTPVLSAQTVIAANSITLKPGFTANGTNGTFIAKLDHPVTGINDGSNSENDYIIRTDYTYKTDSLSNKVFINTPIGIVTKDLLNRTNTVVTNTYDGNYNLIRQTSNFSGVGTKTVEYTLEDGPSYTFIGRLRKQTETMTNGGDSFNTEIQYNNYDISSPQEIKRRGNGTYYITENIGYDIYGNVLSKQVVTPTDGTRTTSMTYETTGRFVNTVTDVQSGLVTNMVHDAVTGNLTSQTDPYSRNTSYIYDNWGRPKTVTNYLGKNTNTAYNRSGSDIEVVETTDEGGYTATVTKAVGKTKTITGKDVLDQYITKTFEYDFYDRLVKESEPGSTSQWNETEYDVYGRVNKLKAYTGKETTIGYVGLVTTVNDGTKSTVTTRNALGNVISTTDPGGTINNTYFANGNLKSADYGGSSQTIEQDGWGRKTKLTDPSAGTYIYTYDQFGQLKSETTPKGVTNYSYNSDGTIATKNVNSEVISTYNYNGDKTLGSIGISGSGTDHTGYTYTYNDTYKRITGITETNAQAVFTKAITYDQYGNVATEENQAQNLSPNITSSKKVTNTYHNGQLKSIADASNSNQLIWEVTQLNAHGQVLNAMLGTNLKQSNTYDSNNYPTELKTEKISVSPFVELVKLSTTFHSTRGNVTDRSNAALGTSETFSYDLQDRLTGFNDGQSRTQIYDTRSRITSNSQVGTYTYTGNSYQQSGLTNLTDFAKYHYQPSQNRQLQQISYNSFKAPVTINEDGRERIDFDYNGGLSRSHMYYGSTNTDKTQRPFVRHYSADGSMEITEDVNNNKTSFIFYMGGDAYSAPAIWKKDITGTNITADGLHYLLRDHLGSIVMITDAAGNIEEKRHFDAWGNIIQTGGSVATLSITDRGFTGHEHLQGVGLINMNARLYDPILHRFLSPDNYVQDPSNTQDYNRYAYVSNNPLKYTDPSGNTRIERQFTEPNAWDMGGGSGGYFNTSGMNAARAFIHQTNGMGINQSMLNAALTGNASAVQAYAGMYGSTIYHSGSGDPSQIQHMIDAIQGNTYSMGDGKFYYNYVLLENYIAPEAKGGSTLSAKLINKTVNTNQGGGWLDKLQTTLDVAGIADPTGAADLLNAAIYTGRGQWANAGISALGIIPYIGDAAKTTRLGKKAVGLTYELIHRGAKGADGGISRHVIERLDGTVISRTHQVFKDSKIIHQHQNHIGTYGTVRSFPEEWLMFPTIK